MKHKTTDLIYNERWLRELMKELMIADNFLLELLSSLRAPSRYSSDEDWAALSKQIDIFKKQLPKFNKLEGLDAKIQSLLDRICTKGENLDAIYSELISIFSDVCQAELTFDCDIRRKASHRLPKFGPHS